MVFTMVRGWRNSIPTILALYQIFCKVSTQQCREEYSIYGMMLRRHSFKSTMASNWNGCIQACNDDVRCQSMNYDIGRQICELNDRTKEAKPEDFVADKYRSYVKRLKRVRLGSIPELPAESCAEIKASEGDHAVSGTYWLSSINSDQPVLASCFSECLNYQTLSSGDRKVTHGVSLLLCDNTLGPAWFRFQGNAGEKMPTSCVPMHKCGTHATGWLNGAHPAVEEGKVTRQVCFSWDSNCCRWSINIQVLNCTSYYLYFISGTPPAYPCNLRYCGTD